MIRVKTLWLKEKLLISRAEDASESVCMRERVKADNPSSSMSGTRVIDIF